VDLERQARIQEERRQAQLQWIADQMRLARAAFNERRFAEAVELLEAVGAIDPQVQGLEQLLQDARAGRAAAEGESRRQREIAQLVAQVDGVAAASRLDEALASIDAMPAWAQSHPDVVARRRDIQAKLDARRRKDELDRRADAAVEAARREFAAGAQAAAIGKLESFSPPHPVVARARDELKVKLESMQRAEREATLKTQCQEAKKQIAAGRFAEALDRLRDMQRTFGQVPEVKELLESARAGKEAAEARVRQEREVAALLDDARRLIERKDFSGAGKRIEKALGIDRTNQQIQEVRAALTVAVDQDRRRVEEEREKQAVEARRKAAAADIRKLLRKKKLDEALQSVGQALAVDANGPELLDLKTTIEGAIAERSRLPQDTSPSFLARLRAVPGWQAGLAAVAVVILVLAVAYPIYKGRSGSKETINTVTLTTIAPTTVPPDVAATTTTPADVRADVTQVVTRIRGLIGRGELYGAASGLAAALRSAPQNADLMQLSGDILEAAATRANGAKAKASSVSNGPAYKSADGHVALAAEARKANRIEPAVAEYLAAERLFAEALKTGSVVAAVTTTMPQQTSQLDVTTFRPTTSTPAVTTSTPVEVVAPRTTSAPPTVVAASIDRATVDALLQQYAAASRTFDLGAIRGVYPDITDRQKLRVERLRKDYSFCEYTFGAPQTVSSSPTEATIRIDSTESCKPKTAQKPIQIPSRQIIHFRKNSSGSWSIGEIFTE
jgi:tetratricopeptide (TPR) repeat protein